MAGPEALIEAYQRTGARNKSLLSELRGILKIFHENKVRFIVLKGADIIPRLYGIMGLRPMNDADLLVRENDLKKIHGLLTARGYRPQKDGNPAYINQADTFCLDLMTSVWYADDTEKIWRNSTVSDFEGIPSRVMEKTDLIIFLTAWTVIHRGYLTSSFAKDIALLIEKEKMNWEEIAVKANFYGLEVPLVYGWRYAAQKAGAKFPAGFLESFVPHTSGEHTLYFLLNRLVREKRTDGLSHFLLLLTCPAKKRFSGLARAFFPSKDFLRHRYQTRGIKAVLIRIARPFVLLYQSLALATKIIYLLAAPR